jgi:hypothetical protein
VAFVEAEWYLDAIFESGNTLLIVGDKLSWNANGTLELAVKTAICSSASVLFNSSDLSGVWNGAFAD